ncbi:hypothetical protein J2S70_001008 [Trueperella bonasi]|uniref:Low molecular weight protein antigen 6 PH domain-containing protein n=1 Tax=Trueperella bonasi TaxID=312286 RepID=A0ABT9NG97_9ACTO|nr:PH domain-containing protein [Trueperella bonasi]MDP9806426.1 hypothetical protein [Trueperella bonasi]
MSEPVFVMRSPGQAIKFALAAAFLVFLLVITYVDSAAVATYQPILIAGGALAIAASLWLLPRIEASPAGIMIVNALRNEVLDWAHVSGFDRKYALTILTNDDERIVSTAFPSGGGLSAGISQLRGDRQAAEPVRWHSQGRHTIRVSQSQALQILERLEEASARAQQPGHRRSIWNTQSLALIVGGTTVSTAGFALLL